MKMDNSSDKSSSNINSMKTHKLFTLIFLRKNQEVLLGHKVRGLGKGYWNGFGGKLEAGESVLNCVKREVKEECNLVVENPKHLGVVRYEVDGKKEVSLVHVFTSFDFTGIEQPSEEMNPIHWYKLSDIPYKQMWPDAIEWYPCMLNNKYFSVHCIYNTQGKIRHNAIKIQGSLAKALKLCDDTYL